ncbi:mechanosensitive ion channel family protein [soil metagenome]
MDPKFLQQTIFENSVQNILLFFTIILAGITLKRFVAAQVSTFFFRFIKKHTAGVDVKQFRDLLHKPVGLFIILMSVYIACNQLHYPISWQLDTEEKFGLRYIIWKMFQLSIAVSFTWTFLRLADFFGLVLLHRSRLTSTKTDDQLVPFVKESIKFIIVLFSFFFILGSVFSVNVASLIAGLGIGGLAFALAAKDTLENLLGSFTIFLDKPFAIGDLVKVGTVQGRVERIGFRSTQIRTLERSLISMPNKKMIDAELENLSMRNMIRALFPLSLRFDTPPDKIESLIAAITELLNQHETVAELPSPFVRFEKITETGIELNVFFFVMTTDADVFVKIREEILFKILRLAQQAEVRFDAKGLEVTIAK